MSVLLEVHDPVKEYRLLRAIALPLVVLAGVAAVFLVAGVVLLRWE